jgi:hypothetical protein
MHKLQIGKTQKQIYLDFYKEVRVSNPHIKRGRTSLAVLRGLPRTKLILKIEKAIDTMQ